MELHVEQTAAQDRTAKRTHKLHWQTSRYRGCHCWCQGPSVEDRLKMGWALGAAVDRVADGPHSPPSVDQCEVSGNVVRDDHRSERTSFGIAGTTLVVKSGKVELGRFGAVDRSDGSGGNKTWYLAHNAVSRDASLMAPCVSRR